MTERAAGAPTEGNAMTEAKRQEAGARFLLLPPLSAAEREAERESQRKLSVVLAEMFGPRGNYSNPEIEAAYEWADRRADGPSVMGGQASRLSVILDVARDNGAQLALIDTPPSAEATALLAAKASDLVLVPTRPSGFDIEAIQTTLEMAAFAKRRAVVVVNAVPCNRIHLGTTAVAGLRQRGFAVAPIMWLERAAFADLGSDGLTAQERDAESKASLEVGELFRWLTGELPSLKAHLGSKASRLPQGDCFQAGSMACGPDSSMASPLAIEVA
jgi:chromosome partitioning protein